MKILIMGESCRDIFHYGESLRLCPDAPVPVFKSIKIIENGGMAKNVENNINSLGLETLLITNENYSNITKTRLVDYRANHMFIRIDQNDENYGKLSEEEVSHIDFEEFDAVIVSDYNKGFFTDTLLKTISLCHNTTFIDTKRVLGEWADSYSFIKLNSTEFAQTEPTLTAALKEKLIITRGAMGSEYGGTTYVVPSVEVKDTSGAGDTFIAALCCEYLKSRDIARAICFANECATRAVQKQGVSII